MFDVHHDSSGKPLGRATVIASTPRGFLPPVHSPRFKKPSNPSGGPSNVKIVPKLNRPNQTGRVVTEDDYVLISLQHWTPNLRTAVEEVIVKSRANEPVFQHTFDSNVQEAINAALKRFGVSFRLRITNPAAVRDKRTLGFVHVSRCVSK